MPAPQPIPGIKYPVHSGLTTLDKPMTRAQAERYGKRRIPSDLKAAGFECVVSYVDNAYWQGIENATPYFRINYGK
jgi:hypothetical protein